MQVNRKLMGHLKHLTSAEVISAIHYLDPDASNSRAGQNAGVILWPILIMLVGAFVYIWLSLRSW